MSMTLSDKVAWSEGVLLRPQHFQQLDRYHESLLAARLDALNQHNWGALRVELDSRALLQGHVSLVAFEGIMPDGTPVAFAQGGASPGPKLRAIQDHFPVGQPSLLVFLAVPTERAGLSNYATQDEPLRYALCARELPDAARDGKQAAIQLAVPNLRLLFGDEPHEGFSALPIAKIVRDAAGQLVFSTSYIPPCLRISCSDAISERLQRLLGSMLGRFRVLRETRRITGEGRVEFTAADVTRYLQLHALNGMFPAIYSLTQTGEASPRGAYLSLMQLAGQLATFAADSDMTEPFELDIMDLEAGFARAFDLCERLLAALDTERYVVCELQRQANGRFYADLNNVRVASCKRFFLGVDSPAPRAEVINELTQRAKLASHGDIEFVLSRNVSGIQVRMSERPPSELPMRPGLSFFELPTPEDDVYWKHVRKDQNLVVWLPPSLDASGCAVHLYGLLSE